MKRLLSIFVLFFAFTLSASAQTEKKEIVQTPEQKAKKDTFELSKTIDVDGDMQAALYQLFLKKHSELEGSKLSEDGKKELSNIIDMKLKATLADEQIKKLQSTGLYEKLIH